MTDGGNMRPLEFTHFGAAGWKITDGETVILLDYVVKVFNLQDFDQPEPLVQNQQAIHVF